MPLVTNENFGDMLLEAAREMVAVQRGELEPAYVERRVLTARHAELRPPPHYAAAEIREIRHRMGVSQRVFAGILNCSPGAVKAWEQELREPDGPTRRLLELADCHPEVLLAAISTGNHAREDVPSEKPELRRAS